jgi:hypothetical protein
VSWGHLGVIGRNPIRVLLARLRDAPRWLAIGVAFVLLSGLVLLQGILWGPYYDAAIFGVVGEQLAHGALPYRDAWDHKPPGIYVVIAALSLMPGPTWPWLWGASVGVIAAAATVVRRLTWWLPAAISLVCMALWPVALGGGQTETFAALPGAGSLAAAASGRWKLAGVLAALALTFSFQLAPLIVALLILAWPSGARMRSIAVGVFAVGAVVTAAFAFTGTLPAAVDVLVIYNRIYLASDRTQDLPLAHHLSLALLPLVVALPFRGLRFSVLERAALGWLVTAALLIALQGRLLPHYAIPLAIPLAVLAAGPLRRRAVAALSLATLVVIFAWASVDALNTLHTTHRGPATELVAAWIDDHTSPADRILMWGGDANIYLASDRRPAGRYIYLIPLVTPGYTTPAMIDAWVSDLARDPPRIIVDSEAANPYWPDGADFFRAPPPGSAGGRDLDLVDPLRQFVREHYRFVIEIAGRKVYERVPE